MNLFGDLQHQVAQVAQAKRFRNEVNGSPFHGVARRVDSREAGDDDDANIGGVLAGASTVGVGGGVAAWEGWMMRMLPAFSMLGASLLLAPAAGSGTLDDIKSSGELKLAYRPDVPPFSSRGRDLQPRGFTIDLCRIIARDDPAQIYRESSGLQISTARRKRWYIRPVRQFELAR